MFSAHAEVINTRLTFESVNALDCYTERLPFIAMSDIKEIGSVRHLPRLLYGDQIHLKQILINLMKIVLSFSAGGHVCLRAAYEEDRELFSVMLRFSGRDVQAS